ncbi:hypothetical protein C4D60_Mb08t25030 [Musa balbisiana]|uniref:Uncharacterized protein n=1 Tax=Musa balbisiana TaxID=52838 RepID=A0A4S8K6B3_MUSBA|nr:hypothetical protein C4D60_Mb08t25030 [Musa balbisiana]
MGFLLLQERRGWRGYNHMKNSYILGRVAHGVREAMSLLLVSLLIKNISSHKEDMSFSHLQDSFTIGLWSSNKRPRHKSPGKKAYQSMCMAERIGGGRFLTQFLMRMPGRIAHHQWDGQVR